MTPIYLLAGAPAVGKSSSAHALAERFPRSLHIPVDDLRSMVVSGVLHPASEWSAGLSEQLALARGCAVEMALRYRQAGFMVAIDDFWDPNSRLAEYEPLFEQAETYRILLHPSRQAAQRRNRQREGGEGGSEYIAAGIQAVYENLEREIPALAAHGWRVVDTTELDLQATVDAILAQSG